MMKFIPKPDGTACGRLERDFKFKTVERLRKIAE